MKYTNFADNRYDPITVHHTGVAGFLETALYGTASSAGFTGLAMLPGGAFLAMAASASEEYTKLRAEHPEIAPSDARLIAAVSGVIQGGMERVQGRWFLGTLPTVEKTMNELANPVITSGLKRTFIRGGITAVGENVVEGAQDLTTPILMNIANALQMDVPGVSAMDILMPWAGERADVAAGLSLMLIGSLFGIHARERRMLNSPEQRQRLLELTGFSPEQISRIEQGGTVEEKLAKARKELANRNQADISRGAKLYQAELDAANAKHFDPEQTKTLSPVLLTAKEQENGVFSLSFSKTNDGKSLPDFVNGIRPVRARSKFRIIRSGEDAVLAQAQRDLESLPEEVTTRDGRRVKIQHPAQGTVETLVTHLATSVNKRTNTTYADSVRAGWIPRIAQTLQEARVKVPQQNGNQIYITSYDDGYNHFVVVKPDGTIDAHGSADALWTQWARRKGEFFGFENSEYSRLGEEATRADASDVHGRKDDAQNVSGQSESAPPAPKGQYPAAPTSKKFATTSPSAQAKTVNSCRQYDEKLALRYSRLSARIGQCHSR